MIYFIEYYKNICNNLGNKDIRKFLRKNNRSNFIINFDNSTLS